MDISNRTVYEFVEATRERKKTGALDKNLNIYNHVAKNLLLSKNQVAGKNRDFLEALDKEHEAIIKIEIDGSQTSDRLIAIAEDEAKDPRRLLECHNYDPDEWELIDATNNLWHGMRSWRLANTRLVMYQSKIRARPKREIGLTLEMIGDYFENFKGKTAEIIKPANNKGEYLGEICLADMHSGKHPYMETSSVEERLKYTIGDIVPRLSPLKLERIYLVSLGDLLHFDNKDKNTTGGTDLNSGGESAEEVFRSTTDMLIAGINDLAAIAPLEIIHIPGNHDRLTSFAMLTALDYYYHKSKAVTVDAGRSARKYRLWGVNLIGWTHGDMPKKNIDKWLHVEAREEWGKAKFAEVHAGHFHTQVTQEDNGMIVRYLPSFTPTDEWHYERGYIGNVQATMSFLWGKELGLREIWQTIIPPEW